MQLAVDSTINLGEAIDRESPIPYYYQLKEYLARLIRSNVLKPGDRLPTEMEICGASGLSRTVVRQAILELENEGYFVRFRAKIPPALPFRKGVCAHKGPGYTILCAQATASAARSKT